MNFSALALVALGGYLLYAYYKNGDGGGGSAVAGAGTGGGSGTSGSGSAGANPPAGGAGTGAGAGGGAVSGSPDADMRPLAAAGDPAWVAIADQSGLRYTFDQWSWYRSQVLPAFTGAEMDLVLAGNDRHTLLLASEWRAAVNAAQMQMRQESAWAT